jgi:D-3-phosphoglycerate dehydrogenase
VSKPFILFSDGFDSKLFKEFSSYGEFETHPQSKVNRGDLLAMGEKINGLIVRSATTVDQELINHCPNLKYVIRAGEGTDNIDKKYCKDRGVKVSNTPGANSNSAAEHAVALILTLLRKTANAHHSMAQGRWDKSLYMGNELWKKRVGFVGFGRIGKIVAKRISGFEPSIYFYDPFIEDSIEPNWKKVSIEEIFQDCDIISVHTPLMDSTKNLVNAKLISLMKKDAILINAARGGIVNESDLLVALKEKMIRGASLDVFEQEPLNEKSELRELDNVVLTPHLGASTGEAQVRVGMMAAQQLREFFLNKNLINEVRV